MKIGKSKHLNKETIKIENQDLEIQILEEFGAKIVSIFDKKTQTELLFQPSKGLYEKPSRGTSFEAYDTSGIDEMLPTIDPCPYPGRNILLHDHGNIWTESWDFEIGEDYVLALVREPVLGLDFSRRLSLDGRIIKLDYRIENMTDQDLYYLWAFHGLFNFGEDTELELPQGRIVNVIDQKTYDFDYRKLNQYPDKASYKFYLKNEIDQGQAKIIHKDKGLEISFEFDTDINKYLGVWISKGGFKNEYNLAIEPSNGYYDSLERAYANKKITMIKKGQALEWKLNLKIDGGKNG